ncbi:hypothetical protein CHRY9390_00134 [Chryseobacterium aquaeductus]|uniref:DUF2147 domain-containing protein n=1 Tax=Chryseobacterium aquaeductus TaxID=2675056 RepID=A0A9N8MF76_9FLAO|nr:hypothetical protein [Chryseobacterium aquaeductus]CAA7329496.1 hypothetical protein CHRY9390_00134 [Chryseobacterium potabilaquae]CAD7797241.1 hypothetical protein CHRY9390_00134 [Chryseobacterium aquaeductus]
MKKLLFFLILAANFGFAQMPDVSKVWLNNSKPYVGTIGNDHQEIKLKINISEQNKKNDQEYFVSGYSLVENNYSKYEGKLTITKYKNGKKKGVIYGDYELSEENKGKHSGSFRGKFIYIFRWNKIKEKIENQYIELIGNWKSYDGTLDFKTNLKNQ